MKTIWLTIFLSGLAITLFAQIPNPSFESWTDYGSYEEPDEWFTENAKYEVDGLEMVKSDNETMDGDLAARLENEEDDNNQVIRAMLVSGSKDLNHWPGFAYSKRPESLAGWYIFEPNGNDSCYFIVRLTRFNTVSKQRDLIGEGVFSSDLETDNYAPFIATVNYFSSLNPDTATIIIYSGRYAGAEKGSRVTVDALEFLEDATGWIVIIDTDELGVTLTPNPAQNIMTINSDTPLPANGSFSIKNLYGKVVKQGPLLTNQVDVSALANGVFYLGITDATGKLLYSGSFVVLH